MTRAFTIVALALGILLGALAQSALALPLKVTIVARQCDSFTKVTANRARNNIMESLQDLGANTPYGQPGVPNIINPAIEAQYQPPPGCVPLVNWVFTFGRNYQTKAVTGVWGALSKVTGEFPTPIVTQSQVPLLNEHGNPISGDPVIQGATTITLDDNAGTDDDEAGLARRGALWIQGGTPTLPITDPDLYSFAALRCAVDNLNGDNVEYIAYPTGYEHVFCYAYYIRPAVTSGKIVVVKKLEGVPPGTGNQTFIFHGDISYNPGGLFEIGASAANPGQISFDRAGGRTWSFAEAVPSGMQLVGPTCVVPAGGTSTWRVTDAATGAVTVTLTAGETVTCTYTNRPLGLVLRKITLGGIGAFDFDVKGQGRSERVTATTTAPGVPVDAVPAERIQSLPAGAYDITEHLPDSDRGTWTKSDHKCGPQGLGLRRSSVTVPVTIPTSGGVMCTFTNTYTPNGSIRLRKETFRGFGTALFIVSPSFGAPKQLKQVATTSADENPATATGDPTSHLALGRYTIQETMAPNSEAGGGWRLDSVVCDGVPVDSTSGGIEVALTESDPSVDCTFTNELLPPPEPGPEPTPEPTPPSPLPPPTPVPEPGTVVEEILAAYAGSSAADLVVTKTASPTRVTVGRRVSYRVTVRNRGEGTARAVTLAEQASGTSRRLRLRASQGRCRGVPPRVCVLGALEPGESATVTVTLRALRAGRFRNTVAVNTVSRQRTRGRKRASAVIRVLPLPRPRFTG